MMYQPVVRITLLTALLLLVGCNDSAASLVEEKNPTQYTSVEISKCMDSIPSVWLDNSKANQNTLLPTTYIGDCSGCTDLHLFALDYCKISADVALDVVGDTLFISYVNVQEASECTCYSNHRFKIPNDHPYHYVKFKGKVFAFTPSKYKKACANVKYKEGYCVENGPTHL